MRGASWFLCAALVAACAPAMDPGRAPLDESFGVREGERVVVDGRLTVGFHDVAEDSRCPADVQCVRAGEAVVVLRLSEAGHRPAELTLRTTPGEDAVTVGAYRVELVGLDPAPRSGRSPPETYVATLRVVRP